MNQMQDIFELFQQADSEFLEQYCIVNHTVLPLAEIEKMKLIEFNTQAKINMPTKLYKYFPNRSTVERQHNGSERTINYSLQALESNRVFLNSPEQFDDVYDSDINVSWEEFVTYRLRQYAQWCECDLTGCATPENLDFAIAQKIYSTLLDKREIIKAFPLEKRTQGEKLSIELFVLRLQKKLNDQGEWSNAISQIMSEEYTELKQRIQRMFRVSCFATSPLSQLMWGSAYANCHQGFCVEYSIDSQSPMYKDAYINLFPVVYCKSRKKVSNHIVSICDAGIDEDTLWDIYFHGTLRKSIDWAFQNEWRLLYPWNALKTGFTMQFFPITKVYLGARMPNENKKEIIDICHARNIPYVGVIRSQDYFEMRECDKLCEQCPKYKVK